MIRFLAEIAEDRFLKRLLPLSEYTSVISSVEMGRGVFANRVIRAGEILGIYPGTYVSLNSFLEKREFINRAIKSTYRHTEDSIIDPTDIFGYVPDKSGLRIALINEPPSGTAINVLPVSTKRYVWFLAILDIGEGEQLFTNYGAQYDRNYSTQNTEVSGLNLSQTQVDTLNKISKAHSWLNEAIARLVSEDAKTRAQ